jgi:hypothetical protein
MGDGDDISPAQLARVFRSVAEWAAVEMHGDRSPFKTMLSEFFGEDPAAGGSPIR